MRGDVRTVGGRVTRWVALVVATTMLALGCAAVPPADLEQADEAPMTSERPLFAAKKAVWPSPIIPVCWVNPSEAMAQRMEWVRDAIATSWEAVSAVQFVGWGPCTSKGPGVRILIQDGHPYSYLGTQGNGRAHSMLLNLTFQNWSSAACKNKIEWCTRIIAVHEFGHALAFDHEQNRPDSPEWCQKDTVGGGDTVIGPWDLDSVMNYCNPTWSGHGNLSDIDIEGVQSLYGLPAPVEPDEPADPCGGLTYEGECQGTKVAWCENDEPRSIDCAPMKKTCGFDQKGNFYNCL